MMAGLPRRIIKVLMIFDDFLYDFREKKPNDNLFNFDVFAGNAETHGGTCSWNFRHSWWKQCKILSCRCRWTWRGKRESLLRRSSQLTHYHINVHFFSPHLKEESLSWNYSCLKSTPCLLLKCGSWQKSTIQTSINWGASVWIYLKVQMMLFFLFNCVFFVFILIFFVHFFIFILIFVCINEKFSIKMWRHFDDFMCIFKGHLV